MGWAGLLGALGQGIGGQMMRDKENERQEKLKKDLEDAQLKRQMFLEKYNSDLHFENQKKLREEEEASKNQQYDQHIEVTPSGRYGYNWKGERKKLGDLDPEEKAQLEEDRKMKKEEAQSRIDARADAASARADAAEERKIRRAEREKLVKETPEEKAARERQDRVAQNISRLVANEDFRKSMGENATDADVLDKAAQISQAADAKAHSAYFGNVVGTGTEEKKAGKPGSTMDNPIDATTLSGPPPSGTWIKKPNGAVVKVP